MLSQKNYSLISFHKIPEQIRETTYFHRFPSHRLTKPINPKLEYSTSSPPSLHTTRPYLDQIEHIDFPRRHVSSAVPMTRNLAMKILFPPQLRSKLPSRIKMIKQKINFDDAPPLSIIPSGIDTGDTYRPIYFNGARRTQFHRSVGLFQGNSVVKNDSLVQIYKATSSSPSSWIFTATSRIFQLGRRAAPHLAHYPF